MPHEIARADIRLELAAAEGVMLVLGPDGNEEPLRNDRDVVLCDTLPTG